MDEQTDHARELAGDCKLKVYKKIPERISVEVDPGLSVLEKEIVISSFLAFIFCHIY